MLPVAQYPEIAPPTVTITANYPGASAETLAQTVAAPIEEQLSGVEKLIYFNSTASSNGTLTITATFEVGTNVDNGGVPRQQPRRRSRCRACPTTCAATASWCRSARLDILLVVALTSSDPRYDTLFLCNLRHGQHGRRAEARARAWPTRTIFGARDYSMRVWLQPDRMARLGVTPTDVANAIRAQNAQYAAGKIGAEPAPPARRSSTRSPRAAGSSSPEEFGNIILRSSGPGGVLRIKDVARVELGAQNYDAFTNRRRQADDRHRRSSCSRAPTRSRWPTRCARPWPSCEGRFRRA